MSHPIVRYAALLLIACSFVSWADDGRAQREQQEVMSSKAFLDAHPDLKYRTEGFILLDEGRAYDARMSFLKSASFADKASQAVLAELAWKGVGQPRDRVLGYVWADIAAERGYPQLVALREMYWEKLTQDERDRAVEIGQPMMDEYGDSAAKKRMALHLRKARRSMLTGRARKDVTVVIPGPQGQQVFIRGHNFYATEYWEPERYQRWVDETWRESSSGSVEVGTLEQVPEQK